MKLKPMFYRSEDGVPPSTPPAALPVEDNSAIRSLREALDKANARAKELDQKVTTLEREKLTESERIRAELEEAKGKLGEAAVFQGRFETAEAKFQKLYESAIQEIPETVRAQAVQLTEAGTTFGDKFDMLTTVKGMLGVVTAAQPKSAGTTTNPGMPPAAPREPHTPAKPLTPAELASMSLTDALNFVPAKA